MATDEKPTPPRFADTDNANMEFRAAIGFYAVGEGWKRRQFVLDRWIDHDTGKVIYIATEGDRLVMDVSDLPKA